MNSFSQLPTIFKCQIVELFLCFIQQKLLFNFTVECLNVAVNTLFLNLKLFQMDFHILDVFLHLRIFSRPNPFDFVFVQLLNITNTLQNISYVINTSLLNIQLSHSVIQIDCVSLASFDQLDKFSCEY